MANAKITPSKCVPSVELSGYWPSVAGRILSLPENEGVEEFKASLMLHFALLLMMTAWFAWRGSMQILARPIIPIRVIGPLSRLIVGSGATLEEKSGTKLAMGVPKAIAKGRKSTLRKNTGISKTLQKSIKQSFQLSPPIEKPAMKHKTSAMCKTDEKAPDKPYVANIHPDEVDDFIMDPEATGSGGVFPATEATGEAKTGTEDLGEPLPLDESLASPMTAETGSGDKADMLSGNIDAMMAAGGGEMEIGDIEALGGGSQRFESPKVISRVLPDYPEWARKKGVKGQAVYKVFIGQSGTVGDVLNMASTIDPQLAIIGSQALRRWVFSPVMVDGEPKETWVKVTVQFHLN